MSADRDRETREVEARKRTGGGTYRCPLCGHYHITSQRR